MPARVSVVISTYNRALGLRTVLEGLRHQTYEDFEVVVVNGPSTDGTTAVLAEYGDRIRTGECREQSLTRSRNVGISIGSGDVVAFIDDDAIPEPGWIAVHCHSPRMAAWLCATILLENVEARCDGARLLLPASSDFALDDQVKSVITVLAKTHHYWQVRVALPVTLPANP